jgi:hypothetical protein
MLRVTQPLPSDGCFSAPIVLALIQYATLYKTRILTYFPYFKKIKIGLCCHHAVCVSVNALLSTFE